MRPNVEAGRHSYVVASIPLDIVGLGISEKGFQVFPAVSQIGSHVLGSIGHAIQYNLDERRKEPAHSETVGGSIRTGIITDAESTLPGLR